jgi:hypothetical protein
MKKKLEAELLSIAHRVLQMKNRSDITKLCLETKKLYDKLVILQFVEEHFEGAKPSIGQAEIVAKMKEFFEENIYSEAIPATNKITSVAKDYDEVKIDSKASNVNQVLNDKRQTSDVSEVDDVAPTENTNLEVTIISEEKVNFMPVEFEPTFELDTNEVEVIETVKKTNPPQISFEDFIGNDYSNTLFVKVEKQEINTKLSLDFELPKIIATRNETNLEIVDKKNTATKVSINDKFAHIFNVDLNDRIAFVKHLFGSSDEDYNRVLNQLITYDNFAEASNFIVEMVKSDYDNWKGKEYYEQRFMEIIEKKFS